MFYTLVYVARGYTRGAAALVADFASSYYCHSVDEHECTKDDLISCLFVLYMFHLRLLV